MSKRTSWKTVSIFLTLMLIVCTILPIGTALAAKSKWVPSATAKSYAYDTSSQVITIDFGLGNWGSDKWEPGPLEQWWKDNHKVNLVMDMMPSATFDQAINARIASKDAPDIWLAGNRSLMYKWADQGVTINDILPLITKYMPTYSKLLEAQDKQTAMTSDKKMVGVPFRPSPIDNVWMVRKDWLDKLHLKVPKTFADLLKVAQAFSKNDPDGNGKNDSYGFDEWGMQTLMAFCNAYGVAGNEAGACWQVKNGQLVWDLQTPQFKQAMQAWANVVKAGYVYPDWANQASVTYDQFCSAIVSGKFGIFPAASWWVADPWNTGVKSDPKMQWISIPNIKGVDGKAVAPQTTPMTPRWMVLNKNLLNDQAKLKRVCRFLDQMMSASNDGYLATFVGVTKDGTETLGGHIVNAGGNLAEDQTNCWWFKKSFTYASIRILDQSIDQVMKGKALLQADPRRLQLQLPARKQSKGVDIVDPLFDLGDTNSLAPDQGKFIGASFMDFLTGKTSFTEWDNFVNTVMTKYKGNEMKEIYTKQLQNQGIKVG